MKRATIISDAGTKQQVLDSPRSVHQFFSTRMSERILDMYISGESLNKISKIEGFPAYGTILRWIKEKPEFRENFEEARKIRALHFEEMARDAAETSEDIDGKDRAAIARLRYDAYKWSAEVSDAERYGKKSAENTGQGNIQIIVNTGVPTNETPTTITVDGKKLQDGE